MIKKITQKDRDKWADELEEREGIKWSDVALSEQELAMGDDGSIGRGEYGLKPPMVKHQKSIKKPTPNRDENN